MSISLLMVAALTGLAGMSVLANPDKSIREALAISWKQGVRVLPIVIPAAFIAGFLGELLPEEFVSRLIGADSGMLGLLLAGVAGSLLPTGPMVVLPVAAGLLQADAGMAQVLTLYNAWTIVNIQRFILWEHPLLGASLAARRYVGGLICMPFAVLTSVGIAQLLT